MKIKTKIIIFLFFIIVFGIVVPAYAGFQEHYTKAQQDFFNARYLSAVEEFNKALNINFLDNSARIGIINSYNALGTFYANKEHNYKEAANNYRSALFYLQYYVDNDIALQSTNSIASTKKSLEYCEKTYGADTSYEGHYKLANELYNAGKLPASMYEYFQIINNNTYRKEALLRIASMMKSINNLAKVKEYDNLIKKEGYDDLSVKDSKNKGNNIDFEPYMIDLQKKIKSNWNPPTDIESRKVILLFKINRKGNLVACKVYKSSGLPSVDLAALKAIKLSTPFAPLPASYKGKNIDVQFSFDYNVFKE